MTLWDACGNRLMVLVEAAEDARLRGASDISSHCFSEGRRVADGVAWFAPREGSFRMIFVNPDGTHERLCGNGLLVAAATLGRSSPVLVLPFDHPPVQAEHVSGRVRASSAVPLSDVVRPRAPFGPVLDTGSPHLVVERGDVGDMDLAGFARPLVAALDVNVTVFALRAAVATVRTFERGVEAETLACGTGALAVALALEHAVEVLYPGGTYTARAERVGQEVCWTLSTSAEGVRRA